VRVRISTSKIYNVRFAITLQKMIMFMCAFKFNYILLKELALMKTPLLTLLFLCLSTQFCFSQKKIEFRFGLNVATTRNLIALPKIRIGYYGGLAYPVSLSKKILLQPEITYSSKGYKALNNLDNSHTRNELSYINFSVLLGVNIDTRTQFLFGPEAGYMLRAKSHLSNGEAIDIYKRYPRKGDAAVCMGIKYKLLSRLLLESRYAYGLRTFYSVDAIGNRYTQENAANRVFQIGVTFKLSKSKTKI